MVLRYEVREEKKYQCLKSRCNIDIANCHSLFHIGLCNSHQNSCLIFRLVIFSCDCDSTEITFFIRVQDCKPYRGKMFGTMAGESTARKLRGTNHKFRTVADGSNCNTRCRLEYRLVLLANASGKS